MKTDWSSLNFYGHKTFTDTQGRARRKCYQFHPYGFSGKLKINVMNVMQRESIDHNLQQNRFLQWGGSKPASLTVPEIAGIKLPHLECSISTIILLFKIVFLYRVVNTDTVTLPPSLPDTKQYRLWAIDPDLVPNLSRRQTCAPAKAIKTPARLWMLCLYRPGYWYKHQKKFIKKDAIRQWE